MHQSLCLLTCSEAEADLYAYRRGREPGAQVRIIRGKRCAVLDRCMAEFAAALQFPYCFEATWESFRTSLRDVAQPGLSNLLLITAAQRVLPRAPGDFAELMQALSEVATPAEPASPGVAVILHTEPRFGDALAERTGKAGVTLRPTDASLAQWRT